MLDAEGHFHATDAPIELGHYPLEAWLAFGLFWLLAADVFYQFFTRYALNSSAAWTEEIARYLLIGTVWIGIAAAVKEERPVLLRIWITPMSCPAFPRTGAQRIDRVRKPVSWSNFRLKRGSA